MPAPRPHPATPLTRRRLLALAAPGLAFAGVVASPLRRLFAEEGLTPTPRDAEGPYYRAGAPARSDLRPRGATGIPLTIEGVVRGTDGAPLAGVTLDLWHADPTGRYDLTSPAYRYRGRVETDARGRYSFRTHVPGQYGSGRFRRPLHIHCKLKGGGARALTTQMYFHTRAPRTQLVELTYTDTEGGRRAHGRWDVVLHRRG